MILDERNAAYVMAVTAAVAAGTLLPEHLSDVCTECLVQQTFSSNDEHVVVVIAHDPPKVAVVICCEGYWRINPSLVGIDSPNWQAAPKLGPGSWSCGVCGEAADHLHCTVCGDHDDHRHCANCGDGVYTDMLSARDWCAGCEREAAR